MFTIGTQDIDSLHRKKIAFEYITASKNNDKKPLDVYIPPSPVRKTKQEPSTRPTKKIKFTNKPAYNFLDTHAQTFTDFSSVKMTSHNLGPYASLFDEFLNKKKTRAKRVQGKILNVKNSYGNKLVTIEIFYSEIEGMSGVMLMICNFNLNPGTNVCLIDPILVEVNDCFYVMPKDVIL